ncbi:hypothetical protein QTP86_011157 [Hemibagrus guttatus]|nr:hypothetical protein QTP86_011157 [Hemibagrus guttatus]
MDRISRRSQGLEGVQFGDHMISSLIFADDVVLLAPSSIGEFWGHFAAECEAAGMRISTSKSEAMVLDRKKVACTLQVGGEVLPQVEEFKYLGVLFMSEGRMDREIDRRIGAAAAVIQSMYRSVVVKKEPSRKAKLSIYQSIYAPTLTYGHELWVMTERVSRSTSPDHSWGFPSVQLGALQEPCLRGGIMSGTTGTVPCQTTEGEEPASVFRSDGVIIRIKVDFLSDLGISTSLRNWIMDFLTNRPQHVRSGHICSTTITLNTGIPQGCVLSPFLYSLFTHDCRPVYGSNSIIKFADDTTVIGLISDDETAYRVEVQHLVEWCADNNLLLNISKTKELMIDFRREKGRTHNPININGMAVERVSSFTFLGTHISEDLSWTTNTSSLVKKAHQRLFYLNTLKKNRLSSTILVNFYRCAIESILTNCIKVWYGNCSVAARKALQQEVKTAQCIIGTPLPAIEDIQKKRCLRRAHSILKDSSHPAHSLFKLLPSGPKPAD